MTLSDAVAVRKETASPKRKDTRAVEEDKPAAKRTKKENAVKPDLNLVASRHVYPPVMEESVANIKLKRDCFEELKNLRNQMVRDKGVQPATILNDSTLLKLSTSPPTSQQDFLSISGFNEAKFKRFGKGFLEITQKYSW